MGKKIKRAKKKSSKGTRSKPRGTHTYLYVLQSVHNAGRSYVGVTNDLMRRLRQHNGELRGGARYTKRDTWNFYAIFRLNSRKDALSLEWKVKHRKSKADGRGLQGIVNRVVRHGQGKNGFQCITS